MNANPVLCTHCNMYGAHQVDIPLNQGHTDDWVVADQTELKRLYGVEKSYADLLKANAQLKRQLRQQDWTSRIGRFFRRKSQIERDQYLELQNRAQQDQKKIKQYETTIDMLNVRIQGQDKKYNKLMMRHNTLMKEE